MAEAEDLAAALRRREEQALTQLYDRYGGAVYHLALRITHDSGVAEEVSLDAFMQVWRQADRFDAHHGSLQSWLFTITRSRAIDRMRAAGAARRTHAEDLTDTMTTADEPEVMADLAQRQRLVRQTLESLSEAQRQALELAYYQGLSHSQIAERIGEPLGTVKTRIRQAMLVMRRALAPMLSTTS